MTFNVYCVHHAILFLQFSIQRSQVVKVIISKDYTNAFIFINLCKNDEPTKIIMSAKASNGRKNTETQ